MTEAVEALARAMGWWMPDGVARWGLDVHEDGYVLTDWSTRSPCDQWLLTPHEAMLVLRCALLGTTRVRCPDCEGGTRWRCVWTNYVDDTELAQSECDARAESLGVPHRVARGTDEAGRSVIDVLRGDPCPTCTGPACSRCGGSGNEGDAVYHEGDTGSLVHDAAGPCVKCEGAIPGKPTGHVDRSWAEVFLRAKPSPAKPTRLVSNAREPDFLDSMMNAIAERRHPREQPGDPDARERLTRLADQLQAQALDGLGGDCPEQHPDLGVWLALWLARAPCDFCGGEDRIGLAPGMVWTSTGAAVPHHACAGSGLALGSHAGAMAEAGQALVEELERRPRAAVK